MTCVLRGIVCKSRNNNDNNNNTVNHNGREIFIHGTLKRTTTTTRMNAVTVTAWRGSLIQQLESFINSAFLVSLHDIFTQ